MRLWQFSLDQLFHKALQTCTQQVRIVGAGAAWDVDVPETRLIRRGTHIRHIPSQGADRVVPVPLFVCTATYMQALQAQETRLAAQTLGTTVPRRYFL